MVNAHLKLPKLKKCRMCREQFQPFRTTQTVCSQKCAQAHAEALRLKKERKEHREAKERIKTRQQWLKEVQVEFNRYIRLRDVRFNSCISCGVSLLRETLGGAYDCGHYRSVGSAPHLRFDPRNAHAQCKRCNRYGSGMHSDYRVGLINRYGVDFVESIESAQEPKKYTIDELKALKAEFKRKCKEMSNG